MIFQQIESGFLISDPFFGCRILGLDSYLPVWLLASGSLKKISNPSTLFKEINLEWMS